MEAFNLSRLSNLSRIHQTPKIRSSSSPSTSTNRTNFINLPILYKNQKSSSHSLAWSNIAKINYMGAVFASQGKTDVQSSASTPGSSSGKPWWNWLAGVILSLALPFAGKWGRLLAIKNEVDNVVKTVETTVEAIEHVAEEVAHIAEGVANQLPEGGKLQNIACSVANVAEEIAEDAHIVDQFIDKVEDVEKEVESVFDDVEKEVESVFEGEAEAHDQVAQDNNLLPSSDKVVELKHEDNPLEVPEEIKDDQPE